MLAQLLGVDDVGVLNQRGQARFLRQHRFQARQILLGWQQRLDRHQLAEAARALQSREPHLAHAAAGDRDE